MCLESTATAEREFGAHGASAGRVAEQGLAWSRRELQLRTRKGRQVGLTHAQSRVLSAHSGAPERAFDQICILSHYGGRKPRAEGVSWVQQARPEGGQRLGGE